MLTEQSPQVLPDSLPVLLERLGLATTGEARPRVGVSACLLGRRVRHDGDHKHDPLISESLAPWLRFAEACPEVGIGLSVPRPPIQVVRTGQGPRVIGVHDHDDVTDALAGQADHLDADLDGFIFKARSPSCGLGTTPVHDPDGRPRGLGDGAYARALRQRRPTWVLANDSDLADRHFLTLFLVRLYCHRHWRLNGELEDLRQRCGTLPEPLPGGTRRYLDRLAATESRVSPR